MKKIIITSIITIGITFQNMDAQTLTKIKDITFGGQNNEESIFTYRDTSGNFYTFGTITQSAVPKDLSVQYGGQDYSVVKYDVNGNKVWDQAYGGGSDDKLYKVLTTPTGFILVGISYSSNSGNKTSSITCASSFPGALIAVARVVWIVELDFSGNILNQTQLCTNWNFQGVNNYGNPFVDVITDFIKLSNGQFIICGNFISYNGPASGQYILGNVAGYARLDANYNLVATRILGESLLFLGSGSYILYSPVYSADCGQAVELPNHDIMFSYTIRATYNLLSCGDYSNSQVTYANTDLYDQFDVFKNSRGFSGHKGSTYARKLLYYKNNVYFFNENIPLPTNTVDLNSCVGTSFYFRTAAARTITGKKDCWIIKLSTTNVPQAEYAFGANDDVSIGDVILDKNNNFILGTSVNSGIGFDKSTAGKGGKDYWILRINSSTMLKTQDYCLGGSSDDLLKKITNYNDIFFLAGNSYSDIGLDKSGANRSGTTSKTDEWTVLMCETPSPPQVQDIGFFSTIPTCKNQVATMVIKNPVGGYNYNWYASTTGSAIHTGTSYTTPTNVIANTSYYVDADNGYCASTKYNFVLAPIPSPNPPAIITKSLVCKGASVYLIAKPDTSGQGTSFSFFTRWYDSDGLTVLHTGDSILISNFSTTKTYFASAVDSFYLPAAFPKMVFCESGQQKIILFPDTAATPSLTLPPFYCYGTNVSLALDNTLPTNTVTWFDSKNTIISNNKTLTLNTVLENDTISVEQTTAIGCVSQKKDFIIPVQKDSSKMAQIVVKNSYCVGSDILLKSTFPLSALYKWYDTENNLIYTGNPYQINNILLTDTVYAVSIGINGCISPDKEVILNINAPMPVFSASKINLNPGDATHFLNSTVGGSAYHWDFGDATYSNSSDPWHYYNAPGQYTVKLSVTDTNACTSLLTKNTYIYVGAFLGISELYSSLGILIYPNPFQESIIIENRNNNEDFELSLVNVFGEEIMADKLNSSKAINTASLPTGVYFIELKKEGIVHRLKLIKTE